MYDQVFINFPVLDLKKAIAFYEGVGGRVNPQFSDETAACIVLSDKIHVMLLTHPKYRQFTNKEIIDAKTGSEVLVCLSADSREAVNDIAEKAKASGGRADPNPPQDYGFMMSRSIEDPDGHVFEIMFMDMEAAAKAMAK
ncbi:VOC family protein [Oryzifoliimicrobium ureilyticus]|uniref:VOC family protein n=1 Tax=Oryzifoliimicrobium ureilyticus TaxID=3113724 RepID=UPI003075F3D3